MTIKRDHWLNAVFSGAGPRPTVRLVLATAARFMDFEDARTFVGIRRIARDSGLATETVVDALAEAEQSGWIERAPFRRGAGREIRAALCGESGQLSGSEVCGESAQSDGESVRVVSGSTRSSVRIHPVKCTDPPHKPSSTPSYLRPQSDPASWTVIEEEAGRVILEWGETSLDGVLSRLPDEMRAHPDARLIVRGVLASHRSRQSA